MVQYNTKLQNELKIMKEKYSNNSSETQIKLISFLQEKNAKWNKEISEKNKELNKLMNEPFVLLESESLTLTTAVIESPAVKLNLLSGPVPNMRDPLSATASNTSLSCCSENSFL